MPDVDQLALLLNAFAEAAVLLDRDRRVLASNEAYQLLTGQDPEALATKIQGGARCYELFPLSVCSSTCVGCAALEQAGPPRTAEVSALNGGATFEVSAVRLTLSSGEIALVETYRRTASDARAELHQQVRSTTRALHKVQAQLLHNEKMSSLGRLVAGIAHELNNPINFIYGNVDFLGQYVEDLVGLVDLIDQELVDDEARARINRFKEQIEFAQIRDDLPKLVRSIRVGAERTAGIVRDLRTFSRTSDADLRATNIVAQLNTTLTLMAPLIRNRIEVQRAIDDNIPEVTCNPGQIGQVFMNLLANAAQAIRGEGVISIAVTTNADRSEVRISIGDTGPGINPGAMARLAEPFFTTKELGEGTGLGLWIVDSIVRAHGGAMTWGNQQHAGAEFVITLPVTAPDSARASVLASLAPPLR
jgi:signal transduction histidine kinase